MTEQESLTALTAEIVSNYVANNTVAVKDLAALIRTVNQTLSGLGQPEPAPVPETHRAGAAQIRKSITPDGLISFIDGRPYKTLKRHLSKHGLSIAAYKETYGLPDDYPTTSATYSARRSEMAKSLGLGRKASPKIAPETPAATKPVRKRKPESTPVEAA